MYSGNSTSNLYENMVELCVGSAMHQVRNLTSEQLNELIYADSKLDAIIDALPQVRSMPTERETDLAQNKSLAEWNLAQQPKLEQMRNQVKVSYEKATQLKEEVDALNKRLAGISSERSLEVTSNLLQVATQEIDDDAEELGKKFANGDVDYILFRDEFLKKKAIAHMRKVKSDRLSRILAEQEYAPPQPAINSRPVSMPVPGQPPYPDLSRHSFW